jgi:hypothetical protein
MIHVVAGLVHQHCLGQAVPNRYAFPHLRVDLLDHAAIGVNQVLMQCSGPRTHRAWQMLQYGKEIDDIGDRAGTIPVINQLLVRNKVTWKLHECTAD